MRNGEPRQFATSLWRPSPLTQRRLTDWSTALPMESGSDFYPSCQQTEEGLLAYRLFDQRLGAVQLSGSDQVRQRSLEQGGPIHRVDRHALPAQPFPRVSKELCQRPQFFSGAGGKAAA